MASPPKKVLSELFVAVDRLVKSPLDKKLVATYLKAAGRLDGIGVPYGFSAGDWQRLRVRLPNSASWLARIRQADADEVTAAMVDEGDEPRGRPTPPVPPPMPPSMVTGKRPMSMPTLTLRIPMPMTRPASPGPSGLETPRCNCETACETWSEVRRSAER